MITSLRCYQLESASVSPGKPDGSKLEDRMSKATEEIVLYDGAMQLREIVMLTGTVIHSYFRRLC